VVDELVAHFLGPALADEHPRRVVHDVARKIPLLVRSGGIDLDAACTGDLLEEFGEVQCRIAVFFVKVGIAEERDEEDECVGILSDEVDYAGLDVRHGGVV
jgi:hypothetical protein